MRLEQMLYEAHHTTDNLTKIIVALVVLLALLIIIWFAYYVSKSERINRNKNGR